MSQNSNTDDDSPALCAECGDNEAVHQDFCDECVETGEKILTSPLGRTTYRVTKWVKRAEGRYISLEKEEIEDE